MILRPILPAGARPAPPPGCVKAWTAIEPTQRQAASQFWLVAQDDHAALAGEIAAALAAPWLPELGSDAVQAVARHDAGWRALDARLRADAAAGKRPRSFIDMTPAEFLVAWQGSIDEAERHSALGGILVSEHFCRLARFRIGVADPDVADPDDANRPLRQFLAGEQQRQRRLAPRQPRSARDLALLTDVLQFCDELSLYLCCGAEADVEFSHRFDGRAIRLHRLPDAVVPGSPTARPLTAACRFDPSPLRQPLSLAVQATRAPAHDGLLAAPLPFLLS